MDQLLYDVMLAATALDRHPQAYTGTHGEADDSVVLDGEYRDYWFTLSSAKTSLGHWYRVLQVEHGYTLAALYELVGVPQSTPRKKRPRGRHNVAVLMKQAQEAESNNLYDTTVDATALKYVPVPQHPQGDPRTEKYALAMVKALHAVPDKQTLVRRWARERSEARKEARAALDRAIRAAYDGGHGVTVLVREGLSYPGRTTPPSRNTVYHSLKRTESTDD